MVHPALRAKHCFALLGRICRRFALSIDVRASLCLIVLPLLVGCSGTTRTIHYSNSTPARSHLHGGGEAIAASVPPGNPERSERSAARRVESLGSSVNTERNELGPVISPDGRTLYFTRYSSLGDQDIWYSTLDSSGRWAAPVIMAPPLTNSFHNFIESVTPDGNTLLLGGAYDEAGKSARQLSVSHRTSSGWSFPEEIRIKNFYSTSRSVSNYLCNDGKTLVMSLERKEGAGAQDLYVSFRVSGTEWSEPLNLGTVVNTPQIEFAPFLAADGKSLYFSSKGHGGSGDADLFVSRRLDSSWQNWSKPENLGPEINTGGWDGYYVIPASGEYAYFASNAVSIGGSDIVRVGLPESVRPRPVTLISGRVLDTEGKPVDATVYYETVSDGMSDGREGGTARTNPATGEYKLILPANTRYAIRAEAPGYVASSEALDATERRVYTEEDLDLQVAPIKVGESAAMRNIFFDFGKARLRSESFPELDRLVELMRREPTITVEIGGHTDHIGSESSNARTSMARACAVASYLLEQGIPAERLTVNGYGESRPISKGEEEVECSRNRRVEFTITGK